MEIVLFIISPEEYFKTVISILKQKFKPGMELIFVTTNKPYNQLIQLFQEAGVPYPDKIFFVDCISHHVSQKILEEPKNCFFVESPTDLTNISIAINETAKQLHGQKILFLDSLSTLLLHNNPTSVGRFSNFLINKMREDNISVALLTLESDMSKEVIKQISSFVDEVYRPNVFPEEFLKYIKLEPNNKTK